MTINLVAFLNFFHILKQATEISHVDSNGVGKSLASIT